MMLIAYCLKAIAEHAGTIESEGDLPFRDSYSEFLTDEDSKQWRIKAVLQHMDQIMKPV